MRFLPLLAIVFLLLGTSYAMASKPAAGISLSLTTKTPTPVAQESVVISLHMAVERDYPKVTLRLAPPEGVTLLQGTQIQLLENLKAGQERDFQWTIQVNNTEQKKLVVTAETSSDPAYVMNAAAVLFLNESPAVKETPVEGKSVDGKNLIIYQAK